MEESFLKSNFIGRDGFRWWIGQIPPVDAWKEQADEQGWGQRYKVRILGYHPYSKGDLPDDDLPWASVVIPPTAGTGGAGYAQSSKIAPGDIVIGFFLDGDNAQLPMILGCFGRTPSVPQDQPSEAFVPFTGFTTNIPPSDRSSNAEGMGDKDKNLSQLIASQESVDKRNKEREDKGKELYKAASNTLGHKDVSADGCGDSFVNNVSAAMDNMFNKIGQGTDLMGEISSATNQIQNLTNSVVSSSVSSLYSSMIPELQGGLDSLYKGTYSTVLAATQNSAAAKLAGIAAQKSMVGPVSKLQDQMGCLGGKIVGGLGGTIRGLLEEALSEVVNTGSCIAEQFAGSLLNSINDEISSALESPLAGVSDIMSAGFKAKDLLSSSSDMFKSLGGFVGCNQSNSNCVGQVKGWTIGKGPDSSFNISGIFDNVTKNASQVAGGGKTFSKPGCSEPPFCGPPVVNIFGGDGFGGFGRAILGNFVSNTDGLSDVTADLTRTASIIGVEIEDPGSSYYYYPPIISFDDPCNNGYGAVGKAIVDQDPSSETFGQITNIIMLSEGENYPVSVDSSDAINSDEIPTGVVKTVIVNSGSDYVDAEAEGYDLTIDNGRIISATPINNVKTIELPKITVKSSTGSGAIIKPILGRLPLTPQGEVIQIIDCVK